jgi:hypothetical protein
VVAKVPRVERMPLDAILDRTFAAAEANDWATFRSMFADDAVMKQNVGPEQSIDQAMNFALRERPTGRWQIEHHRNA